ncbi:MAG: nucleoside recognition domain-containing protein, partial [Parafannyhessea umbonata]|nr:nucleoside recognition domain-containing protein [Parafannyhessea umbonata]
EQLDQAEEVIAAVEKSRDDDAESIVTGERYDWIASVMDACVKKAPKRLTTSQKIDRVVTNRVLGLPIFAAVMIAVYWVALVAVGTPATDWVNDNLFSDGFFVNSASQQAYDEDTAAYADGHYADKIDGFLAAAGEKGVDTSAVSKALAADDRGAADERAIRAFESKAADVVARDVPQHDGDGNLTHDGGEVVTKLDAKGNAVLASGQKLDVVKTVTLADFKKAVNAQEPDPHDYDGFVDSVPTAVTGWLQNAGASDAVVSLVVDGVIGGVGSVLGFIPQIFVLFVLLCFLEDCGYMSRVAFVMDRVFRRFGLSGKSFIPMIVSSGCGVPGVLATKTIENERDRRMTAMLTTMIPCSAKLPIISLVMGVLIGADNGAWWVAPMFYFLGIVAIVVSAVMLKKTKPFQGEPMPFV